MKLKKILLVNPSMEELYENAKVKASVPIYPPLNLLTVASTLINDGHDVKVIDLDVYPRKEIFQQFKNVMLDFKPDLLGLTFTSALYSQCMKIVDMAREINPQIIIAAGGTHASSDVESTLKNTNIDVAIMGEGDFTLSEYLRGNSIDKIKGFAYKKGGKVYVNEKREFLKDLDQIPIPAWHLVDPTKYKIPYTMCKANPVAPIETSRGCAWGCTYCTKSVFGRNFRFKSPRRVVDEIKELVRNGFKEFHIYDDMFTTRKDRVKEICRLMIEENVKIHWNCLNGIRVDVIDDEMISLMKNSGCYRVAFGVESGDDEILKSVEKNQTIEKVREAFKICKRVGIEIVGFFMLGLPAEREEHLKKTIKFAIELDPDIAKFDIFTPLPSTPLYTQLKEKGLITISSWDELGFHKGKETWSHPNLNQKTIKKYYGKAFRQFYLRPRFIVKRFMKSLKEGNVMKDMKTFLDVRWYERYWDDDKGARKEPVQEIMEPNLIVE
jgi:anaerobic magnesium-protoporphyrin IX monomethyl ester cyclase